MGRRSLTPLVLGLTGLLLGDGCATMVRGTTQEVAIASEPPGAVVTLSDGRRCVAPCTLEASRKEALRVTLARPGCDTYTTALVPTLSGAGVALGGLPDYRTGAIYDLRPNPLAVKLARRARPLFPE
jgi:hypothetical protein